MTRIVGSIQARMGATRFPGKVMKEICSKPMLLWQVERIRRSRLLNEVIVATTTNPNDDAIANFCEASGIIYFRGSENDVLSRIATLVKEFDVDVHAEFYGDSPLADAGIIDEMIAFYLKHRQEYDSVLNSLKTTYPSGQEVVIYRGSALVEADNIVAKDDPLREHCGLHITRNKDKFRIHNIEAPPRYRYPDIYLEVDTPEDFKLISNIIGHFAAKGKDYFSLSEILDYLGEHKELVSINNKIHRKWKAFRKDD